MKKMFLISALAILTSFTVVKAQDTLSVKAGVLVAPMCTISLKNPKEGFKTFVPVTIFFRFSRGSNAIVSQYNLTTNSAGVRVSHDFSSKLTVYVLGLKNVIAKGGYAEVGAETPVIGEKAFLFTGIGTSLDSWSPALYCGVFLPFKIKVK